MKYLFNVLILVIALFSCSNEGSKVGTYSGTKIEGNNEGVYHFQSDELLVKLMGNGPYDNSDNGTSRITHDIYFNSNTGVLEIKGPKVNTRVQLVDEMDNGESYTFSYMSIDDRKKSDPNVLNTFVELYYKFDKSKPNLDGKAATVALVTNNKNNTSLLEALYLPLGSFYVFKRMIVSIHKTAYSY